MGAELVRLAASGRIDTVDNRIAVQDSAATGDAELDAARLVSAEVIQAGEKGIFGRARWRIAAPARAAEVRARLDAIANAAGTVDIAEAAFGGLAHAVGLDRVLYPGSGGRQLRKPRSRLLPPATRAQADTPSAP